MRFFTHTDSRLRHRTRLQRDANELDREVFDIIARFEELAEHVDKKAHDDQLIGDEEQLLMLAQLIRSSRAAIRKHMHPDDVENTR